MSREARTILATALLCKLKLATDAVRQIAEGDGQYSTLVSVKGLLDEGVDLIEAMEKV